MSADTHTTAPRHGETDERYTGGVRHSRLAVEPFPSGAQPAVAATRRGRAAEGGARALLSWDEDSRTLTVLGREPRLRQIVGVCGWAALLGVVGLAVGIRGFIADLMDKAPSWYEPMMIGVGLAGIVLTVGAFISVHRRHTPYILLGAATVVLGYAIFLTGQAL